MSLTPEQRARILYLWHVEGLSVVMLAMMTGLSRSTVTRVLHETRREDGPGVGREAAMRPSSKGKVERQLHLRLFSAAPQQDPPRRRYRRERRHDRT